MTFETDFNVIGQHARVEFLIITQIDDIKDEKNANSGLRMCCHRDSPNIFPVRWCVRSGLRLLASKGMDVLCSSGFGLYLYSALILLTLK